MTSESRMAVWRSPAGRIHLSRRCSGNGRQADTVRTLLTEDQFNAYAETDNKCRCIVNGFRPNEKVAKR